MLRSSILIGFVLAAPAWAVAASNILIDPFTDPPGPTGQVVSQTGAGGSPSFISAASVLGTERDVSAAVSTGAVTTNAIAINVAGSGVLTQTQTGPDPIFTLVQWDGIDGSGGINPIGLGGINFTAGSNNAVRIVVGTSSPVNITFSVFTNDPGFLFSTATQTISNVSLASIDFPFATFSGSADFTNVGAIMMTINSTTSGTVTTVDSVQTAIAVPEPAAMVLLAMGFVSLRRARHQPWRL